MKKLLFLLLVLSVSLFALVSCSGTGDGAGGDGAPVDEEAWLDATKDTNFQNVTFDMRCSARGTEIPDNAEVFSAKLNPDKVEIDGVVQTDELTITSLRSWYVESSLAILDNFDNFEYDAENDCFVSKTDIVYNVTVMGYDAKITASNVSVSLDDNMNIAKIVCDMDQEFIDDNNEPEKFELYVEFKFYDYGTTVVG